jgi:hypothetical protein
MLASAVMLKKKGSHDFSPPASRTFHRPQNKRSPILPSCLCVLNLCFGLPLAGNRSLAVDVLTEISSNILA